MLVAAAAGGVAAVASDRAEPKACDRERGESEPTTERAAQRRGGAGGLGGGEGLTCLERERVTDMKAIVEE